MKNLSLIASALAMLGLTACEKGLVEGTYSVYAVGGASSSDFVLRKGAHIERLAHHRERRLHDNRSASVKVIR